MLYHRNEPYNCLLPKLDGQRILSRSKFAVPQGQRAINANKSIA